MSALGWLVAFAIPFAIPVAIAIAVLAPIVGVDTRPSEADPPEVWFGQRP
jgi:hypothetical protein